MSISCSGNDFRVIRAPFREHTSSESKGTAWRADEHLLHRHEHPLLKQQHLCALWDSSSSSSPLLSCSVLLLRDSHLCAAATTFGAPVQGSCLWAVSPPGSRESKEGEATCAASDTGTGGTSAKTKARQQPWFNIKQEKMFNAVATHSHPVSTATSQLH